jgi:hypothetical protein
MKYPLLIIAALFLLVSCKPPEPPEPSEPPKPPQINATETGKSGLGGQTIKGGDVTMTFSADGKPLTFTRGNRSNLINTQNPGMGFYLTTGSGPDEKIIPFTSLESQDGKLILTAADNTRATLAVNAGNSHISFHLEKIENVPNGSEPILKLQATFNNICPMSVPLDYMVEPGNFYAPRRVTLNAAWPFYWMRGDNDPLGGFAFFVPLNDDDHNETLLRIWTGTIYRIRRSMANGPTSAPRHGSRSGRANSPTPIHCPSAPRNPRISMFCLITPRNSMSTASTSTRTPGAGRIGSMTATRCR